uniref:SAGA-associated factor 11 n=1 Tax=Ditylenchus dipsaci TaxID=166011 RepID=A0A915EPI5_9BILA
MGEIARSAKDSKLRKIVSVLSKNMFLLVLSVLKTFFDCVFEDALTSTIFGIHRDIAIGKATGIAEEEDEDERLQSTAESCDIFSLELSHSKRSVECKCFVCGRMIVAIRFAPHLEKCIGGGRNSRVSRRRLTSYMESVKIPSIVATTRASRTNIAVRNTHPSPSANFIAEDFEDEEEDEWTAGTNRRRPKTRAVKRLMGEVKQPKSTAPS